MAADSRGSSSLFRRDEQLTRWQNSETNQQQIFDRSDKQKVRFSDGCIFLAAGAAGDKDELKRLLTKGVDINTVNQDGITALHAACIDNNLEIVEFLVDNNADINRCDMEGWTPLHATASCGSLSIAEFLLSRGSDLSVVNNDGELAIDVVDEDDMAQFLKEEMDHRGIDSVASRSREERHMLEDAQSWLSNKQVLDEPHDKTGATALHVAAAKGYIKILRMLLDAGVDVNTKDFDGWTALHAASHWGQAEAVEILCDNMAEMDILNCVGQAAYDLASNSIKPLMDELRRKQASIKLINQNKLMSKKRKPSPHKDKSNKKEKESLRGDSDGTSSSDESLTHHVDKRTLASGVDQTEVQSWRRPSLRNKTINDHRNSREESSRVNSSSIYVNHKDDDVILRKDSTSHKEERNCQDILRLQDNIYVTSSQASNINTSLSTSPTKLMSRSFVPPSRDDESETQRKAHAKMVRSTRRSTQGITLEDVKSAEQFIKTRSASTSNAESAQQLSSIVTVDTITSKQSNNTASNQDSSFSVDSSRTKDKTSESETTETISITLPLRKKSLPDESKKVSTEEKPDDKMPNTREGTQAVIQRKKRAKRRSTGVVTVSIEDIDPDKRRDRIKSSEDDEIMSVGDRECLKSRSVSRSSSAVGSHNGDFDYKKLYEEQLSENEKLLDRLRLNDRELRQAKDSIDTNNKSTNSRQLLAESERREKRGLERKLSEMEEELRELEILRQENQRLKDENGALIRVISKLSR